MRKLWGFVQEKMENERKRQNIFLLLNTFVWTIGAFLAAFIIGILIMPLGWKVLWYAVLAAGYSGVFIGFLGGCIFLMRNTPE